jgi:hypothetical protein
MKLGISSEDLQDLILKRLDFMKNMRSSDEGKGNANPKVGVILL